MKPGIEPATPGLQGKRFIYYTMAAPSCHARLQEFGGGGGGVQVHMTYKKISRNVFVSVMFIYRSKMVNYKEKNHLPRFQRVPVQHFPGAGSNFFQGGRGSNCLFPIETHISCYFPGERVRFPPPPDLPMLAELYIHIGIYRSPYWK